MSTIWQGLSAFLYSGKDLTSEQTGYFLAAGGRWVAPVLYGDDAAGPWNLAHIDELKSRFPKVGCWATYNGESAETFAKAVGKIVHVHNIGPVVLDCEASVQGNTKMSQVARAIRRELPTRSIAVTTNSLNDSVVYNGRIEGLPTQEWRSFWDLGIRVIPQWYNSPLYEGSCWSNPVCNLDWLKTYGHLDNLRDRTAPASRAVPISYVHAALEVSGVEGADLEDGLQELKLAKDYGYTYGVTLYTLERTSREDFALLDRYRTSLYV